MNQLLPFYFRAINSINQLSVSAPKSKMYIHLKHLLHWSIQLVYPTPLWKFFEFRDCIFLNFVPPGGKKCLLNEYSCNTNVAGIWMAQYKYTTIKWEGALNSQHMLLGTRLVNIYFWKQLLWFSSKANMKLEYTGFRFFLFLLCCRNACLVTWLQWYRPLIFILN